jgi:hypothetical protein
MYSIAPITYRSRGDARPMMARFDKALAADDENKNRRIFE